MKAFITTIVLFNSFLRSNGADIFDRNFIRSANSEVPSFRQSRSLDDHWLRQKLNHFNRTDTKKWKQRYFVKHEFYNKTAGPIFLFLHGEGSMGDKMYNGAWLAFAKHFGALCFQLEPRLYGKSLPTKDMSTESLKYLSSKLALADAAVFVLRMNRKYKIPRNTKWITFGSSYSASLAAWMRIRYPNSIYGALSSSAPILAKADFRVIADTIKQHSAECLEKIHEATSQVDSILKDKNGVKFLDRLFSTCSPLDVYNKPNDISMFRKSLVNGFAYRATYNVELDSWCNHMTAKTNSSSSSIERLATLDDPAYCFLNNYDALIKGFKDRTDDDLPFTYQTCTEFGWFGTSSYKPQVFGTKFPVSKFINSRIHQTNRCYGGLNANVSNIVTTHGSLDPWHALGFRKTINPKSPLIIFEGGTHCEDMLPPSDKNSLRTKKAHAIIMRHLKRWIQA